MSDTKYVTRRVSDCKTYNVYKMEGTTLKLIDTIERKGKVSENELAKEYKLDKVVLDCINEKKIVYGVPVETYMKIAKVIKVKETNKDTDEPKEAKAEIKTK